MFIFGLCSTSDDWPSDLSNESHPKCKKMATKLSKNEMFLFGLHSTSDDQLSNPSDESCLKCEKIADRSKTEMFIFGLCSTSDDWLSDLSDESHLKCEKWLPNHQKMKCNLRTHPPSDEMGTGQEQYGNGPGMGRGWDRYGMG